MSALRRFLILAIVLMVTIAPLNAQDVDLTELPDSIMFLLDSFNGDFEGYETYIHPDWQWGGNGIVQFEGHEGYVNALTFWTTVFPDLEYEVLHAVGSEDVWAVGVHLTGTNTGGFEPMGIVANDHPLDFYGYGFMYIEDGMLILCDWTWDWITWYEALGIPYGPSEEETED